MDLSHEGFSGGSLDGSKVGVDEKREHVYELLKSPGASDVLQTWSRQEILQVLCAEMGKERKYTGLTKFKMIEQLLKIVSEKTGQSRDMEADEAQESSQNTLKRQRKTAQPSRIPPPPVFPISPSYPRSPLLCKNSACKAVLRPNELFCKRCSCCLCHLFDDNKDPSLWLNCNSEPPFQGPSCGISCHLECALNLETKQPLHSSYDGAFQCPSCGKINDLLCCWKKQLFAAKETRRVDSLCYRLSLSHKLLLNSVKYQQVHQIVDEAVKELESEVGSLSGVPAKMGRGIVNRLSSGPQVQKRCALALNALENLLSSNASPKVPTEDAHAQTTVRFEDLSATSLAVIVSFEGLSSLPVKYNLWYRKTSDEDYETSPTKTLQPPHTKFTVENLSPSTEYLFKVTSFNDMTQLGTCEVQRVTSGANPERSQTSGLSMEDENIKAAVGNGDAGGRSDENAKSTRREHVEEGAKEVTTEARLPITPSKMEGTKEGKKKTAEEAQDGSTSKKGDEECSGVRDLEYYVKVIRWLECDGHLEKNFRQKFLTWYSLRASPVERRVVKAFVDALIEDPPSLAEQLLDAFSDCVSARDLSVVPAGFCMKLWH